MSGVENGVMAVDAMTADEVSGRVESIQARLGGEASVGLAIGQYKRGGYISLSVSPFDVLSDQDRQNFTGSSWAEIFGKADAWLATYGTVRREGTIRKMALDIIDLTDMEGSCTEQALMRRGHSWGDVKSLSEAACQRASEMSGNAPFVVLEARKAPRA
jgi:hypothetical protein